MLSDKKNSQKLSKYRFFKKYYAPKHNRISSKDMNATQWKNFNMQWKLFKNRHKSLEKDSSHNKDVQPDSSKQSHKSKKNEPSKGKSHSGFKSNNKHRDKKRAKKLTPAERRIELRQKAINKYRKSQSDRKYKLKTMHHNLGARVKAGKDTLNKENGVERLFDSRLLSSKLAGKESILGENLMGSNSGFANFLGLTFKLMAEDDKKTVGSRCLNAVSPLGIKQSLKRHREHKHIQKLVERNKEDKLREANKKTASIHRHFATNSEPSKPSNDDDLEL